MSKFKEQDLTKYTYPLPSDWEQTAIADFNKYKEGDERINKTNLDTQKAINVMQDMCKLYDLCLEYNNLPKETLKVDILEINKNYMIIGFTDYNINKYIDIFANFMISNLTYIKYQAKGKIFKGYFYQCSLIVAIIEYIKIIIQSMKLRKYRIYLRDNNAKNKKQCYECFYNIFNVMQNETK